ncbi:Transposase protein [Popillia japonica]|uniref:Transposase protein n=1 Tax=Popillia japonica TaxID=7064 RepID=A0AAW1HS01_POPJA
MLNTIPYIAGINKQIFNSLKVSVDRLRNEKDRLCIVVFDEISIAPSLLYNRKLHCIDGVEDYGTRRSPHIADHANVFMVKGIYRQWKQALSFSFSNGPTKSIDLKNMLVEVIRECQNIGLKVMATVCDQGSANQAAINSLLRETREQCQRANCDSKYVGFLVNGKEIIPLYDVPHLFKGIRNNLVTKNLQLVFNEKLITAKWEHVQQFYLLDTMDETRMCPKLTDSHVFAEKINKMKVSIMAQVFSHQVSSLMKRISQRDTNSEYGLVPGAKETGEFILFMDSLFDSLNGNNKQAPSTKPLKGGITSNSPHEIFWRDAIKVMETMKFYDASKKRFVNEMTYFLPRAVNQDCLENFFASIRTYSRRNVNPNCSQFMTSFKALLVNNFRSHHSPGANCEEDYAAGALDNLKCFLTGEEIRGIHPLEDTSPEVAIPQNIKKTRVAECTIAYFAGYIAKKSLKNVDCRDCNSVLLHSDGNIPVDVIEARQYKHAVLQKPGSYLYYVTNRALSILFYLIHKHCHEHHLNKILDAALRQQINFTPLNCRNGHELAGGIKKKYYLADALHFLIPFVKTSRKQKGNLNLDCELNQSIADSDDDDAGSKVQESQEIDLEVQVTNTQPQLDKTESPDDETLLACLKTSDIEGFDEGNNDSENEELDAFENFNNERPPIEANAEQPNEQTSSESSSDSDLELNIPLSELRNRYGRKTWKKSERKNSGDIPENILQFLDFKLQVASYYFAEGGNKDENSGLNLRLTTRNNPPGYACTPLPTPNSTKRRMIHLPKLMLIKNSMRCKNEMENKAKKYKRFRYSEKALSGALEDIRTSNLTISSASKRYGIPKSTIVNKMKGKVPLVRKMGPSSILTAAEERELERCIVSKAKLGFSMHSDEVQDFSSTLVKFNRTAKSVPKQQTRSELVTPVFTKASKYNQTTKAAVTEEAIRS